jgi:hypothetical protein
MVDRLAADGYGLVGGIGEYENIWRMAYARGPEGIIVSLADRIACPPTHSPWGHAGGVRLDDRLAS